MKLSRSFLIKSVIFSIIGLLAFLPGHLFHITQQKAVDKSFNIYKQNDAIADSIISKSFNQNLPKYIEGFDFDSLNDLGEKINVDFYDLSKQIKKPYGSTFLSSVEDLAIISIVKQLAKSIINSNLSKQLIFSSLSLIIYICIFIFFVLVFPKCKTSTEPRNTSKIKRINIILINILLILVVYCTYVVLPICYKTITSTPEIYFTEINYSIGPFITFIACLLGLLMLYFMYYHYLKYAKKVKLTSLLMIIPFITMTCNILNFSNFLDLLNTSIEQQNLNTNRQITIYNCTRLANYSRQWFLENLDEGEVSISDFSFSKINLPEDIDTDLYSFEFKDSLIIFNGKMINVIEKDTVKVAQSYYYLNIDSIRSLFVNP